MRTLLVLLLATFLIILPTGCTENQVIDTVTVGVDIASSAAGTLVLVSPNAAKLLNTISKDLGDAKTLYESYEKASATDKPGLAGEIHAALSAITANMTVLLQDTNIRSNSRAAQDLSVALGLINGAVQILLNHLPAISVRASIFQARNLPLPPPTVKSPSDMAKVWNTQIKGRGSIRIP